MIVDDATFSYMPADKAGGIRKLVQLVKTARKRDRCIEDLGDDILRRAYLDFIYVHPIVLWFTCKARRVGLLVY